MKTILLAGVATLALSGCTATQGADLAACAAAVQAALASLPANASVADKAFATGMAAATAPACANLSVDVVAAFGGVKTNMGPAAVVRH